MKHVPITHSQYKARTFGNSTIDIKMHDLPLELHQMIVWAMMKPEYAIYLVPEYQRIRAESDAKEEGSAVNMGLEP